jgi:hypothetical protein
MQISRPQPWTIRQEKRADTPHFLEILSLNSQRKGNLAAFDMFTTMDALLRA